MKTSGTTRKNTPPMKHSIASKVDATITYNDVIGKTIVGYRYGAAPENGRSWNYQNHEFEPGVSMASVGFDKEIGSFAVSDASATRKKYYYVGTIVDTGGDGEICLENVKRITRDEYLSERKKMVGVSNMVVNARINRSISVINKGYSTGKTIPQLEAERLVYLK